MEKEISQVQLDALEELCKMSQKDLEEGRVKSARELLAERRAKQKDNKLEE